MNIEFHQGQFRPTLSDTPNLDPPVKGAEIAVAGTIKYTCQDGQTVTQVIPAGWVAGGPYRITAFIKHFWSTGTTTITGNDILCGR